MLVDGVIASFDCWWSRLADMFASERISFGDRFLHGDPFAGIHPWSLLSEAPRSRDRGLVF